MILENPAEVVAQTVFGKYVEASGLVFTGPQIEMMIDRTLKRVLSGAWVDQFGADQARIAHGFKAELRRPEDGEWGNRYHTGVDFGRRTDFTVISTLDTAPIWQGRPARLVYYRRLNRVPWEAIYGEVGRARQLFGPNILCDGSGPAGDVVMDALEARAYCPVHERTVEVGNVCQRDGQFLSGCSSRIYLPLSCCESYVFSAQTKRELVQHLRNVLDYGYDKKSPESPFGQIRTPPIPQLQEELTFYEWDDAKLETDCLFSLALAAWSGLEDPRPPALVGSAHGE